MSATTRENLERIVASSTSLAESCHEAKNRADHLTAAARAQEALYWLALTEKAKADTRADLPAPHNHLG